MSLPSASVQQSELGSSTNASLILTFFMGSYTIVYLQTMYLYLKRKGPQRVVVLCAVTSLFLIAAMQFGIQWYSMQISLPQTKSDLATAYVALFQMPQWTHIALEVTSFAMYIIADGLLIWRCYHVYGRLRRIIILPLLLLVVEIGLVITSITYFFIVDSNVSQHEIDISNDIQSGVFFASFATSLSTTILIAHRIYTSSRNVNGAKKRFIHILEIIIQSAAIYSAVLLVAAISGALPNGDSWPSPAIFALANYSSSILAPAAGMAPTIMVARVSLASGSDNTTSTGRPQLSQLEFHRSNQFTSYSKSRGNVVLGFSDTDSSSGRGSFLREEKMELA